MKKQGLLHAELSYVIASLGHTDTLGLVDAGFPIPEETTRVDLALKPGFPSFLDVLDILLDEIVVEEMIVARETKEQNGPLYQTLLTLCHNKNIAITSIDHEQLKNASARCRAIVRTGECVPYANLILRSGVSF